MRGAKPALRLHQRLRPGDVLLHRGGRRGRLLQWRNQWPLEEDDPHIVLFARVNPPDEDAAEAQGEAQREQGLCGQGPCACVWCVWCVCGVRAWTSA